MTQISIPLLGNDLWWHRNDSLWYNHLVLLNNFVLLNILMNPTFHFVFITVMYLKITTFHLSLLNSDVSQDYVLVYLDPHRYQEEPSSLLETYTPTIHRENIVLCYLSLCSTFCDTWVETTVLMWCFWMWLFINGDML